jgi:hypothetical protein
MNPVRVYFNNDGYMMDFTSRNGDIYYIGKDRIPLYTIDSVVRYSPNMADGIFIVSDEEGHETTIDLDRCHVDLHTLKTYIYSKELHRVFKFELQDTLFLFEDFCFFGDVTKQMATVVPDIVAHNKSLRLW